MTTIGPLYITVEFLGIDVTVKLTEKQEKLIEKFERMFKK